MKGQTFLLLQNLLNYKNPKSLKVGYWGTKPLVSQGLPYPLIKEYTLNHNRIPNMI